MWIKVKKLDITKGVRGSWRFCPVARAIRRATGYQMKITVRDWSADIESKGGQEIERLLPPVAQDFITRFDCGIMELLPPSFSFQIAKPRFVRGRPSA